MLFFSIDIILTEVSILGVNKLKGFDFHFGSILAEGLSGHIFFRT
jgi:hypothetical protein